MSSKAKKQHIVEKNQDESNLDENFESTLQEFERMLKEKKMSYDTVINPASNTCK